uniref:ATP synthase subunit a n=1 Tax=Pseudobiotus spinifer TaxID=1477120 RepID=A0A0K0KA22_9BILA|nr:ATP synthase F0 subunit 6 [Pseudobiotus spinifer]
MMNSLFESFDPHMSLMHFNTMSIFMVALSPIFFSYIFNTSSRSNTCFKTLFNTMFEELKASSSNKNNKSNILMLTCIFFLILTLNLLGLMPYIYTVTSQMLFSFNLALPVWMGMLLFSVSKNTNHFFSHLVPLSTPMALSQFMTIIETISQIIRPITLSVRLCANMTAGHILMALASSSILILNMTSLSLMVLLILEFAVAFIQSYVFVMLLSMYLSETL